MPALCLVERGFRAMKTWFIVLASVVIAGCNAKPRTDKPTHPRSNRPYAPPTVVFSGDSKDLQQSVVISQIWKAWTNES